MKKLIVIIGCILLLSSCDMPFSKKTKLVLDNPSKSEINVLIDSSEHTVPSESSVNIKVSYGEHVLINMSNDEEVEEKFKTDEKTPNGSILNPTLSDYVLWKTYYSINKEPIPDEYLDRVNIGGIKYEGFIKQTDELLIENNWDYDLDTNEPDQVEVVEGEESKILSKIWRYSEFKNEYFRRYPNEKPE